MIPKVIHYCWMSGEPFPELIQECIDTWKKILPDYQIIEWNKENFDVNISSFTKEAFEAKKYAFVSDYVRLYALYNYGGIYLDSDIKVLKSFTDLLNNRAFSGFESNDRVGVWLLASEKGNPLFKEMLDCYKDKHFIKSDGRLDLEPNTSLLKSILKKYGVEFNNKYQKNDYITIYPKEYFCPLDGTTGEVNITNNSYAMHLFNGAWLSKEQKEYFKLYKFHYNRYSKIYPNLIANLLSKVIVNYKIEGIIGCIKKLLKRISMKIFQEKKY